MIMDMACFGEILEACRAYRIVPNITTSGFMMMDDEIALIRKYCGAVAVSWYSRLMNGNGVDISI